MSQNKEADAELALIDQKYNSQINKILEEISKREVAEAEKEYNVKINKIFAELMEREIAQVTSQIDTKLLIVSDSIFLLKSEA